MFKILKNKNLYNLIGIFVFVFLFFFIAKNVFADFWEYRYDTPVTICGYLDNGVYTSKDGTIVSGQAICNEKVKEQHPTALLGCVKYIEMTPGCAIALPAPKINNSSSGVYTLLAPIGKEYTEIKTNDIGKYFNTMFLLAIGLAAVLAVIMIIIGGVEWMGSESVFGKTEGKKRITSAVLGLLIALGAYALLNTINPALLGGKVTVDSANIELEGDVNAPVTIVMANMNTVGIKCDKSGYSSLSTVAKSFNGKMTYSQDIPKGQLGPSNTIKYDCSGFVNAVLQCSGVDTTALGLNSGTSNIFGNPKAEKVIDKNQSTSSSINGKTLQVGDLIGWRPTDDSSGNGHVMIYLGGGLVADSHSPRDLVGQAYGEFSLEKYRDRITYVVRTQTL